MKKGRKVKELIAPAQTVALKCDYDFLMLIIRRAAAWVDLEMSIARLTFLFTEKLLFDVTRR